MATLSPSSIMHGASGKVGGVVFRQSFGKTVVQAHHESPVKRSELQLVFNHKMREAAWHARAAMRDPAVKAHYEKKKKRLNVTSAYTAACTDFLRHGCIDKIDTSKYHKGQIVVKAFKTDLGFEELTIKISTKDGKLVTTARGIGQQQGHWFFQTNVSLPKLEDAIITVEAKDKTGNTTRVVQEHGKDAVELHDWQGAPHLGGAIFK